jgi:hypothetical protein
MNVEQVIARLDWPGIEAQLDHEGHAVLAGLLGQREVRDLTAEKPRLIAAMRAAFYKHLVPIANRWSDRLGMSPRYPDTLNDFACQSGRPRLNRSHSTVHVLEAGEYQALHQHTFGDHPFPLQLVALLSQPGQDFTGGEFVMTEQRPRMQSRPMVLSLRKGDVAIITVAQRPHEGTKGDYRVNLKHAVSRVRSGKRVGMELLFHDGWQE